MLKIFSKVIFITFFILAFFGKPDLAKAQFVFNRNIHIPVHENGRQLNFPWVGGFNNAQFSDADLNNDGVLDLVIFDRSGDKLSTFINHGTPNKVDYTYAPEYADKFPELHFWVLMDDFDCDGIEDIFASTPGYIDYYKGSYDNANFIHFDSITHFEYNSYFSGILNIFVTHIDVPAFIDVNNDGDMDVLTFGLSGGVLEYFENLSQELTGTCADTIIFEQRSTCWGDFYELTVTNKVVLDSCGGWTRDTCVSALKTSGKTSGGSRHAGSTTLAYDEDGDGDKEVILGDISFDLINRLINGGNEDCADIVAQDHTFPLYDVPYECSIFPASFYVDLNNDGLNDLIVAPNDPKTSENYRCIWYYKNVGAPDSVVFEFQNDTFFVNETLDFGSGAYPVFFDYNGDNLTDILVGNYGYYTNGVLYRSGLALLKNTGDPVTPVFELVDRDYAGLSAIFSQRKAIYPALGDMDADGDKDMIVGDNEGYIHYFENTGNGTANFVLTTPQYFDIDFNSYAAPFIYDVNGDTLPDLIIGAGNGKLEYFENKGTGAVAFFSDTPTNSNFGNVDVRVPGFPTGNATPVIAKLDSSAKTYLLAGNYEGRIEVYEFDLNSIYGGSFTMMFDKYSGIDEGESVSFSIADLNMDGKFEMVTGNFRGGLTFYSQSDSIALPVQAIDEFRFPGISVYPNPAGEFINIQIDDLRSEENLKTEIFDVLGKSVSRQDFGIAQGSFISKIKTQNLSSGIYFLRVQIGNSSRTLKVLIND